MKEQEEHKQIKMGKLLNQENFMKKFDIWINKIEK